MARYSWSLWWIRHLWFWHSKWSSHVFLTKKWHFIGLYLRYIFAEKNLFISSQSERALRRPIEDWLEEPKLTSTNFCRWKAKNVDSQKSIIWSDILLQTIGYLKKVDRKASKEKNRNRQIQVKNSWSFVFDFMHFF